MEFWNKQAVLYCNITLVCAFVLILEHARENMINMCWVLCEHARLHTCFQVNLHLNLYFLSYNIISRILLFNLCSSKKKTFLCCSNQELCSKILLEKQVFVFATLYRKCESKSTQYLSLSNNEHER